MAPVSKSGLVVNLGGPTSSSTIDWVGPAKRAGLLFMDATPRLVVGQTFQMSVGTVDAKRNVVRVEGATWRSSDPANVSVSAKGLITGVSTGKATITASVGNSSTSARVTVYPATATTPVIASIEITPNVDTLDVGTTQQFTATARDATGVVIANASVAWRSADTTLVQMTNDGLLSAKNVGQAQVLASAGTITQRAQVTVNNSPVRTITLSPKALALNTSGTASFSVAATRANGGSVPVTELKLFAKRGTVTGTSYSAPATAGVDTILATASNGVRAELPVTVNAPAAAPPAAEPPAVGANSVGLSLVRFDGGSGPVLVSSGVPLAPGQLMPANVARTRLLIGGVEVPARITALKGLHLDGSLRAVLVQATASIGATSVGAELQLTTAPSQPVPAAQPVQSIPTAMFLPGTAQLLASRIVGRTRSIDSTSIAGFDAQFKQYADQQFAASGAIWTENYYDRVLNHVTFWSRGGSAVYMRRALAIALDYRKTYLEANDYGSSPHWSQLEGLAVHYWLTGDEMSRTAVLRTTDRLSGGFSIADMAKPDYIYNEGRIEARVLMGNVLSAVLEGGPSYRSAAAAYVTGILGLVRPNGSFAWPNWCGLQANYMVALQNDALIKYTEMIGPDARIAPKMKLMLDYLWSTQWIPGSGAFQYASGTCKDQGGTEAAPDVNMFFTSSFAWYYKQTGDATYQLRADQIAQGALAKAWISPSKQFNEFYYSAFSYLWYRR